MGFLGLGGKKKQASTRSDEAGTDQVAAKPGTRTVARGQAEAGTDRRTRASRRVVAAKPGGARPAGPKRPMPVKAGGDQPSDHLDLAAEAAGAQPKRPATAVAPATAPAPAALPRPAGPCRTGDTALLTFLTGKAGLVNAEQATAMQAKAAAEGIPLDAAGVALHVFSEEQLLNALTQECWVPHLKVDKYEIRKKALDTIPQDDAEHYGVFPVDKLGSLLTMAMVNPLDADAIRALEAKTGLDIKKVVATRSEIAQAIDRYYGGKVAARDATMAFTQDVEPRSVTQMMANVGAPAPQPKIEPEKPDDAISGIQDIDDLLSAGDEIAPAIIDAAPLVVPAAEVVEIVDVPASPALEARTRDALEVTTSIPTTPAKAKPLDLDLEYESGSRPAIATIAAPVPQSGALSRNRPAAEIAPALPTTRTHARSGSAGAATALVPVMEDEFRHAITHGKAHVFEKWVGIQTRNRILNALPVETEVAELLSA